MTKKELRKISLQFRTLSSQMLKIDSEEEKGCIVSFYNFITETPFIHNYLIECHKQDYNFEDCFEQHGFGRKIILPSDQEELIDLEYQLLKYILDGKRALFTYGMHYTSSRKYADMINAFMRKTIEPFVVALRSYLELSIIDAEEVSNRNDNNPDQVTAFLSYCQKDSEIADLIDNGLKAVLHDSLQISRDIRDVPYHASFKQFMQTIQEHDFVIILISDRYLKSRNCMFEVTEAVKDVKYQSRLLFVVLQEEDKKHLSAGVDNTIAADLYSTEGQTKYMVYWKGREAELQQQIDQIGDPIAAINQIKEKKNVQRILLDLPDFLEFINDNKGLSLEEHIKENYHSMCRFMGFEV